MFESLTLKNLPEKSSLSLRKPSKTRPHIWLVEENGKRAIVKDFSRQSFFQRNLVGRILIWREKRAYKKIGPLEGVPVYYRTLDTLAIVLGEIKGKNLQDIENELLQEEKKLGILKNSKRRKEIFSESFFDSLTSLVKSYHKLGVVHCDLKRTPNIILGDDGKPYIVDWASALFKSSFKFSPFNLLYEIFLRDDFLAITKLKVINRPDIATEFEKASYAERSRLEILLRFVRDRGRGLLKRM